MSYAEVAFCATGIYFFYLYYGVLQERIFKPEADGDKFIFTSFLLSVQCVFNLSLGYLGVRLTGGKGVTKPISKTADTFPFKGVSITGGTWLRLISLSYLAAMACSNEALQHVSYPFQALAKSCKMVPVMIASVLIGGAHYSYLEYLAVACITTGVILFQFAKSSNTNFSDGNSSFGMGLLFTSLCLDGFTSSNQKLFGKEFKPSGHYMMYQMNLWSVVYLLPLLLFSGEAFLAVDYVMTHPDLLYDVIQFSICSALGQQFIFFCVVGPGPLVCTTITTTRKFFTVLLSIVMFPENKLNIFQWGSVALVFSGLGIELIREMFHSKKKTE